MLRSNDIFYKQFNLFNTSGCAFNFDVVWVTMVKNGVDDRSVKTFIKNCDLGRYTVSGVIPSTYVENNYINLSVSGLVQDQLYKGILDIGYLDPVIIKH